MDVASLLYKADANDDLVCAGFLHDAIEDVEKTGVTEEEVRKEFGDKITDLVMAVTETDKSLSWLERKTTSIEHLKTASKDVKLLKCADKLSNLKDIFSEIKKQGEKEAFSVFKVGKDQQKIYYKGVLEQLDEIKDFEMYKEYKRLVEKIFG
ncbi:MAG: HD domain-containing protein [archaeon]|jgi:(p)ppGpp synthase/HD superfamily hydrolase